MDITKTPANRTADVKLARRIIARLAGDNISEARLDRDAEKLVRLLVDRSSGLTDDDYPEFCGNE